MLAALVCAAGCAASSPAELGRLPLMRLPAPDSAVRDAFAKLFDANTGRFTETMTAQVGASTLIRTTTGQFDLAASRAALSTRFRPQTALPAQVAGAGATVPGSALDEDLRREGTVLYLTKPAWRDQRRGQWVRYAGGWVAGLGRQWTPSLRAPWDTDRDLTDPSPTPLFALPQKMAGTGRLLAPAGGRDRYEIRVPVDEALAVVGASELAGPASSGPAGSGPAGSGPDGSGPDGDLVPVEVDVAADRSLARVHLDATGLVTAKLGPAGLGAGTTRLVYDLVLTGLGRPVGVAVPPAGQVVSGGVATWDLRTGTCLAEDPAAPGEDVLDRPYAAPLRCSQPHRYEVYARVSLGGDTDQYPGRPELTRRARQACTARLERFAGGTPGDLGVRLGVQPPGASLWLQGVHDAPCVAALGETVTGSVGDASG